ncbi:MAG TPA: 5-formyltetrahydrofolate cyclo-ligase [Nitriliruptoraceae bacterium]|nr:5-formyltetrahydrofolate cyclo-ligase [Nitriliruptoraceae bacterium]
MVPDVLVARVVTPNAHDADAGGDAGLLAAKALLREQTWSALADAGAGRFPGIRHRIPNFVGAEAAAERLAETTAWEHASVVKCNPDSPQWPVRTRALQDGKTVVMAVPRLASMPPFMVLDPEDLDVAPRQASSIKGSSQHARPAGVADLDPIDLVVQGCVGVDMDGHRLGKGGGFADLEFAVTVAAGILDPDVVVATTVHDVQVLDESVPTGAHDVELDLVVTPTRVITVHRHGARDVALDPDLLTEDKRTAIPLLTEVLGR